MVTTVKEIMRTDFVTLRKKDSISKVITLFTTEPDMVFPVANAEGRIIGEVNQHEILKLAVPPRMMGEEHVLGPTGIRDFLEHDAKVVGDIMRTHDIKIKENMSVAEAAKIMLETDMRTLEVVDGRGVVGFVSELDILHYLKKKIESKK